ncbi:hypothetical protein TNIN_328261 [Trichonephila inaurata madagascariensis]|uniref:Uncharacterized protein n=1 Tax=Trichonephila inaurata madagascariensis TaxID=2747483 RepID=A0A8X7BZ55_9ARAC|nr:hypothetical protein TNIN_328261 [Trichonephila inaurata madagascariensis]
MRKETLHEIAKRSLRSFYLFPDWSRSEKQSSPALQDVIPGRAFPALTQEKALYSVDAPQQIHPRDSNKYCSFLILVNYILIAPLERFFRFD